MVVIKETRKDEKTLKKMMCVLMALVILASTLTACGGGYSRSGSSYSGSSYSSDYSGGSDSQESYSGYSSGSVSGSWGAQMARSRGRSYPYGMQEPPEGNMGYTFPFVFNEPLRSCNGFTLDYQIMEVSHGNLEGNFRYEVLVRTVQGDWKSAGTFQMNGYSASLDVQLDQPRGIDAVAVVCGKQDKVIYSFDLSVSNPW